MAVNLEMFYIIRAVYILDHTRLNLAFSPYAVLRRKMN